MVMARQVRSLYYYTRPKGPPVAYGHHLVAYRAAHGIRLAAWFPAALVAAFVWLVHCVATRSPAWLRPEAWCEVLGERTAWGVWAWLEVRCGAVASRLHAADYLLQACAQPSKARHQCRPEPAYPAARRRFSSTDASAGLEPRPLL